MRALRSLIWSLLSAGAIVAWAGCALVSSSPTPGSSPHLPRVEVELPGKRSSRDSAPEWRPAPMVNVPAQVNDSAKSTPPSAPTSQPANTSTVTTDPAQEIRQQLDKLVADGALERTQYDELVKNLAQTDPATMQHLLWMYRAIAQRGKSPPSVEQVAAKPPAPRLREKPSSDHAGSLAIATDSTEPKTSSPTTSAPSASVAKQQPAALDEPSEEKFPIRQVTAIEELSTERATIPAKVPAAASASAPLDTDRPTSLDQVIRAMETAVESAPTDEQAKLHAQLRMLYLTAGRKHDAVQPIPGLGEAEQDFFAKELFGLATYLDESRTSDRGRRAAEASRHLHAALQRLGETSPLGVRNLAFCSEVSSYGVYTSFPKLEFKPAQQLLLYAEVENFKSDESAKGFHTAFKSHYQILDAQGRKVDEHDFALAEERCQNPRRDYFLRYFVNLPQRIYDGRYTLQLTVEDTLAKKVGQATIEFTIKTK